MGCISSLNCLHILKQIKQTSDKKPWYKIKILSRLHYLQKFKTEKITPLAFKRDNWTKSNKSSKLLKHYKIKKSTVILKKSTIIRLNP